MPKIFIIGLPRTGTTSLCASLLDLDFKVAHTAYTQESFQLADVIADTPVYCHYPQLDQLFPDSKFIYLNRNLEAWIPSIQTLLKKLSASSLLSKGTRHPLLKQCFTETFGHIHQKPINDVEHLQQCYLQHASAVKAYFSLKKTEQMIQLDIEKPNQLRKLITFLDIKTDGFDDSKEDFPHLNAEGKINDWNKLRHENKVNSNARGPQRAKYFDFFIP